ncbi:MAG: hypothetical protein BGO39_04880 [Chloroflexi bacterium 54-19]|nr:MAG: hypothetical protein BGO39_04880 [Chloroflexi bacterium 54-19]
MIAFWLVEGFCSGFAKFLYLARCLRLARLFEISHLPILLQTSENYTTHFPQKQPQNFEKWPGVC